MPADSGLAVMLVWLSFAGECHSTPEATNAAGRTPLPENVAVRRFPLVLGDPS
jgi:hypothetical protein